MEKIEQLNSKKPVTKADIVEMLKAIKADIAEIREAVEKIEPE